MAEKNVTYIQPPNNLRQKQKLAGVGQLDAHWIDAAERSIAAAKFDYLDAVNEDLARLQSAYERAASDRANRVEHTKAIYAEVQTIKGQGTSFGYPLMTAVGNQLARFIEDCGDNPTDGQMEGVKVHIDTLRLIMQQKMEGDGGPIGQKLIAGLDLVIKKMTAEAGMPAS
jgi:hypothetical protein